MNAQPKYQSITDELAARLPANQYAELACVFQAVNLQHIGFATSTLTGIKDLLAHVRFLRSALALYVDPDKFNAQADQLLADESLKTINITREQYEAETRLAAAISPDGDSDPYLFRLRALLLLASLSRARNETAFLKANVDDLAKVIDSICTSERGSKYASLFAEAHEDVPPAEPVGKYLTQLVSILKADSQNSKLAGVLESKYQAYANKLQTGEPFEVAPALPIKLDANSSLRASLPNTYPGRTKKATGRRGGRPRVKSATPGRGFRTPPPKQLINPTGEVHPGKTDLGSPSEPRSEKDLAINIQEFDPGDRTAGEMSFEDLEEEVPTATFSPSAVLLTEHISVLSAGEAVDLVRTIQASIDEDLKKEKYLSAFLSLLILFMLASGLNSDAIGKLKFGNEHVDDPKYPTVNLLTGVLRRPALGPKKKSKKKLRPRSQASEQLIKWISVHLPPALMGVAKKVLLQLEKHPTAIPPVTRHLLREHLHTIPGIPSISRSLIRIKQVLPVRAYELSNDLSVAMLLTGDTLWRAITPLHYVVAEHSNLEQTYRDAIWPLFEASTDAYKFQECAALVGSPDLITQAHAKQLVDSLMGRIVASSAMPKALPLSEADIARIVELHNGLTCQIATYIAHITTHRPTDALFRLTRNDFDLICHLAVLSDKRTDPEHWYRVVATTPQLSKQILLYLAHLKILATLLPEQHRAAVNKALSGGGPLLFLLNADLSPSPLNLDRWKEYLGPNWGELADNWHRPFMATHLRMCKAPPPAADQHLGHLEAAGHPFVKGSCATATEIADSVRPALTEVEKRFGWKTRRGLAADPVSAFDEPPPLTDWTASFKELDAEMATVSRNLRAVANTSFKQHMPEGWIAAGESINEVRPDLLVFLRDTAKYSERLSKVVPQEEPPDRAMALTIDEVRSIEEKIDSRYEKDFAKKCAARNALFLLARHADRRGNWHIPSPRPLLDRRLADSTPFFSGMMSARTAVLGMRRACGQLPFSKSYDQALAKAALFLILFSTVSEPQEVLDILTARDEQIHQLPGVPDATLVQITHFGRLQTYLLRGPAALACLSLRKRYKPNIGSTLREESLSQHLFDFLSAASPDWHLRCQSADQLLRRLCTTVAANHRLEQSGLLRGAYSEEGATSMPLLSQIAYLTDAPASQFRTLRSDQIANTSKRSNAAASDDSDLTYRYLDAYHDLLSVIDYQPNEPRTKFYQRVDKELRERIESRQYPDIVDCIARYTWDLFRQNRGVHRDGKLAAATVAKYLGSFARPLIRLMADDDQPSIGGKSKEQLLALYSEIIRQRQGRESQSITVTQLADFNLVLVQSFGAPAISHAELDPKESSPRSPADTTVVSREEVRRAQEVLTNQLAHEKPTRAGLDFQGHRIDAGARVCFILLAASGARLSEIVKLRLGDILRTQDSVFLRIRGSRFKKLKSRASKRLKNIRHALYAEEELLLFDWIERVKSSTAGKFDDQTPIFNCEDVPSIERVMSIMRATMRRAFWIANGTAFNPHWLRHLRVIHELVKAIALPCHEGHWVSLAPGQDSNLPAAHDAWWRRNQKLKEVSASFGHTTPATSVKHYFHLEWMLTSSAPFLDAVALDRSTVAAANDSDSMNAIAALGSRQEARRKSDGDSSKWTIEKKRYVRLVAVIERTTIPGHEPQGVSSDEGPWPLKPFDLMTSSADFADVMRRASKTAKPNELLRAHWLPDCFIPVIDKQIDFLYRATGYNVHSAQEKIVQKALKNGSDGYAEALKGVKAGRFGLLQRDPSSLTAFLMRIAVDSDCDGQAHLRSVCDSFASTRAAPGMRTLRLEAIAIRKLRDLLFRSPDVAPLVEYQESSNNMAALSIKRKPRADIEPSPEAKERLTQNPQLYWALALCWIWFRLVDLCQSAEKRNAPAIRR